MHTPPPGHITAATFLMSEELSPPLTARFSMVIRTIHTTCPPFTDTDAGGASGGKVRCTHDKRIPQLPSIDPAIPNMMPRKSGKPGKRRPGLTLTRAAVCYQLLLLLLLLVTTLLIPYCIVCCYDTPSNRILCRHGLIGKLRVSRYSRSQMNDCTFSYNRHDPKPSFMATTINTVDTVMLLFLHVWARTNAVPHTISTTVSECGYTWSTLCLLSTNPPPPPPG